MGDIADPPWAGLWAFDRNSKPSGLIVVVQNPELLEDGIPAVDLYVYHTEEELRGAWAEFEKTVEGVEQED